MARTLYISGTWLAQHGAIAARVFRAVGGGLDISAVPGYVPASGQHNHYELEAQIRYGVAGHFWLASGTTNSPAWIPYGGGEVLHWTPPGGVTAPVSVHGATIYRPSQILWWIADDFFALNNLTPGTKAGRVGNALNQAIGPLPQPG